MCVFIQTVLVQQQQLQRVIISSSIPIVEVVWMDDDDGSANYSMIFIQIRSNLWTMYTNTNY